MAQAIAVAFFASLAALAIAGLCGGLRAAINLWIVVMALWSAAAVTALGAVALGVLS